jgi:hypothetical protein
LGKGNEYASGHWPRHFAGALGLAALVIALLPLPTGHQGHLTLAAGPAEGSERSHLIASPFGTIHAATFS